MFDFLMKDPEMMKTEPIVIKEIPKPVTVEFVVKDKYETKYKGTDEFWFVDENNKVYPIIFNYSPEVYNNLYTWKTSRIGDVIRIIKHKSNRTYDKFEIVKTVNA